MVTVSLVTKTDASGESLWSYPQKVTKSLFLPVEFSLPAKVVAGPGSPGWKGHP